MSELKVGLAGLGTVGSGVIELLADQAAHIAAVAGAPIRVVACASRTPKPDLTGEIPFLESLDALASHPEVDVVVETIGGEEPALTLARQTLETRKAFVTANKALVARHGSVLFELAERCGADLRYESSVVAGVPVIKTLREGLAANQVDWMAGIINGTTNFILTSMQRDGREFAEVLAEAQALGYAEADPTFDVEGIDAAHKLTILAAIGLGIPLSFDAVATEGIGHVTAEDLEYAEQLGYRIKHLAIARRTERGVELRVHPALVPAGELLASVDGVTNAVQFGAHAAGPVSCTGAGAGSLATASGIVADLIDLARGNGARGLGVESSRLDAPVLLPLSEVETAHYLRIPVVDRPGVLSAVTDALGRQGISIESVIQKSQAVRHPDNEEDWVPIVLITGVCPDARVAAAVEALAALPESRGEIVRIRVEHLND